jgi:acyl-CoA thioester hydrolase
MQAFVWQLRVYWEDTDAGGVVYHSRYLNFFERARTEWLRELGVNQAELVRDENRLFAITHMDIRFRQAARLDDVLDLTVESVDAGASRLVFRQVMTRVGDGAVIVEADVTAACLDAAGFQPTRMPAWIRAEIKNAK